MDSPVGLRLARRRPACSRRSRQDLRRLAESLAFRPRVFRWLGEGWRGPLKGLRRLAAFSRAREGLLIRKTRAFMPRVSLIGLAARAQPSVRWAVCPAGWTGDPDFGFPPASKLTSPTEDGLGRALRNIRRVEPALAYRCTVVAMRHAAVVAFVMNASRNYESRSIQKAH
jgi:hypothetical protein